MTSVSLTHRTRSRRIGMPEMAVGGLSENWLFRELGHIHRSHLFEHLKVPSDDYVDAHNRRVYPTFARIRIEASHPLQVMQEHDLILMSNQMLHLADGSAISQTSMQYDSTSLQATCLTIDAVYNGRNQALTRATGLYGAIIQGDSDFEQYYRRLRRGSINTHTLLSHRFTLQTDAIFEAVYEINPSYDINDVNLLYFTTYPTIHDVSERQYMHAHYPQLVTGDWACMSSTLARDVFFFRNCRVDDRVVVRLYDVNHLRPDQMAFRSCLYRESDGKLMAMLFTIKQVSLS